MTAYIRSFGSQRLNELGRSHYCDDDILSYSGSLETSVFRHFVRSCQSYSSEIATMTSATRITRRIYILCLEVSSASFETEKEFKVQSEQGPQEGSALLS